MSNDNPFNILSENVTESTENKSADLDTRIKSLIESSQVFLFMKGNPDFPQCGFSANAIAILRNLGAEFKSFDILTIDIHHIQNGKIVQTYHVEDWAGALQQLKAK